MTLLVYKTGINGYRRILSGNETAKRIGVTDLRLGSPILFSLPDGGFPVRVRELSEDEDLWDGERAFRRQGGEYVEEGIDTL